MPLRHITEDERLAEAPVTGGNRRVDDEAVLDAVRRLVLTHGIERTTLTDVAREAGLSRMTVYRRWSGLPQLLGAMMQREWDGLLRLEPAMLDLQDPSVAGDVRHLLVRGTVTAARTLRESELLSSILAREPQLVLPYVVEREGTIHRRAAGLLAEGIRRGQAEGSVRLGDPVRMATAVIMTAQSWVVSMAAAGASHDPAALDEELTRILTAYLTPGAPR